MLLLFAGPTKTDAGARLSRTYIRGAGEDDLRYLVSSLDVSGAAPRMLLVGPSEMREDLLHYQLASAFPVMKDTRADKAVAH